MQHLIRFVVLALILTCASCRQPQPPVGFTVLGKQAPAWTEDIRIPAGYTEQRAETHTAVPPTSEREKLRGYLTFTRNYLEPVYPYTTPTRREVTDTLKTFASRGEYEPVTFCLYALWNLKQVSIEVSELRGPRLSTIAAVNIDVRSVRYWPRRVWKNPPVPQYRMEPWFLEKRSRVDIPAHTTQRFWLTAYVPPDTPAGDYCGKIKITGEILEPATLDIKLEVLPITLVEPARRHGMYYHMFDKSQPKPNTPYSNDYLYKEIMNMRAHGMNTMFPILYPEVKGTLHADGTVSYDLTPIECFVETCLAAGMDAGIWNMTYDCLLAGHGGPSSTSNNIRGFYHSFIGRGWPGPIISYGDESDAHGQTAGIYNTLKQIKSHLPEAETYTSIVFDENSERFEPYVDIRAFSSFMGQTAIERTRQADRKLWMYSGPAEFDVRRNRFYRGLWGAATGLDGILDWVYFDVYDPDKLFNDLERSAGGGPNHRGWVVPTDDGPLPTMPWEAIREGIDDGKYYHTLQVAIDQAQQSGDTQKKALAGEAQLFLDETMASVDTTSVKPEEIPLGGDAYPLSRAGEKFALGYLDQLRYQVARYIVQLQ
jgi:hypothetical protein